MKSMFILLEIIILAVLACFIPNNFSTEIIICELVFYVIQLFRIYKLRRRDHIFSFNMLFFIMFTLVTFLLPVLILLNLDSLIVTHIQYNIKYLPKALLVCLLAVSCYTYGYKRGLQKVGGQKTIDYSSCCKLRHFSKISVIIVACLFVFLFNFMVRENSRDLHGFVLSLLNPFLFLSAFSAGLCNNYEKNGYYSFFKKNRIAVVCSVIVIVQMVLLGDRLTALTLLCTWAYIIDEYIKPFSRTTFIFGIIIGFILMFLVGFTRSDGVSLSRGVQNFDNRYDELAMFEDVLPINADLCIGVQWMETNGYFKPSRIFVYPFYPIPVLPSIMKREFFDGNISTAMELTLYNKSLTTIQNDSGIGTHIVMDIYMSWGIIGVIICFILFGLLVGKCQSNIGGSIIHPIVFLILMAYAIYLPRDTIFNLFRDIVYLYFLYRIVIKS